MFRHFAVAATVVATLMGSPSAQAESQPSVIVLQGAQTVETVGDWTILSDTDFCFAAGAPVSENGPRLYYGRSKIGNATVLGAAPANASVSAWAPDIATEIQLQRDRGQAVTASIGVYIVDVLGEMPGVLPVLLARQDQDPLATVFRSANWIEIDVGAQNGPRTFVKDRFPLSGSSKAADAVERCKTAS